MFQKVLEYAGAYRRTTYLSMVVMLIGIVMNVLPFLFIYQLIRPLLLGESLELGYAAWRVAAIAVCGVLYAVLYVRGLSLSHRAAYNTLKNLRNNGIRALRMDEGDQLIAVRETDGQQRFPDAFA